MTENKKILIVDDVAPSPLTPKITAEAILDATPEIKKTEIGELNPMGNLLERLKAQKKMDVKKRKTTGAFGGGARHNHIAGWKRTSKPKLKKKA